MNSDPSNDSLLPLLADILKNSHDENQNRVHAEESADDSLKVFEFRYRDDDDDLPLFTGLEYRPNQNRW